jgi:hypothetical protein
VKKAKNIKPIWEDYRNWEDYKNGMYENGHSDDIINQCYEILTGDNLKQEMYDTTITYEISTQVNFTNQMFNPVSWLGQATCNRLINATAQEVCEAWMSMTKEQQDWANNIAKEVIEEWRNKYESLQ